MHKYGWEWSCHPMDIPTPSVSSQGEQVFINNVRQQPPNLRLLRTRKAFPAPSGAYHSASLLLLLAPDPYREMLWAVASVAHRPSRLCAQTFRQMWLPRAFLWTDQVPGAAVTWWNRKGCSQQGGAFSKPCFTLFCLISKSLSAGELMASQSSTVLGNDMLAHSDGTEWLTAAALHTHCKASRDCWVYERNIWNCRHSV